MQLNWNFLRGREGGSNKKKKNIHGGGMDIFFEQHNVTKL